jgi:hypothetical protein
LFEGEITGESFVSAAAVNEMDEGVLMVMLHYQPAVGW